MTSSTKSEKYVQLGKCFQVEIMEADLRKEKVKSKSNFTRSRNSLLRKIKYHKLPTYTEILNDCENLDTCMEKVIEILSNYTAFYIENMDIERSNILIDEMETVETEYRTTYEIAWAFLDSRACAETRSLLESCSIDKERRITTGGDTNSDYSSKVQITPSQTVDKVGIFDQHNQCAIAKKCRLQKDKNIEKSIGSITVFTPTDGVTGPNIKNDMWTQLKRIQIPFFSGDKKAYPRWKAAFLACIDKAPVTSEYKMLQLRQYVSGEALTAIENLGHSPSAYEAAKDRLERKYGGKRRRIAIFLEDLEQFKQIQSGNASELEKFADLLDLTVINLKEAGENQDLGDGSLYIQLQKKLPQSLLARYHRWLFENSVTASVMALRTWVVEESRFQTIASETVYGLTGRAGDDRSNSSTQNKPEQTEHRTFLVNQESCHHQRKRSCQVCESQHRIWKCRAFIHEEIPERWNLARIFQLCYRCLAEGHQGKSCRKTRRCGIDGCNKVHHRLLHVNAVKSTVSEQTSTNEPILKGYTKQRQERQGALSTSSGHLTSDMEGKSLIKSESEKFTGETSN